MSPAARGFLDEDMLRGYAHNLHQHLAADAIGIGLSVVYALRDPRDDEISHRIVRTVIELQSFAHFTPQVGVRFRASRRARNSAL